MTATATSSPSNATAPAKPNASLVPTTPPHPQGRRPNSPITPTANSPLQPNPPGGTWATTYYPPDLDGTPGLLNTFTNPNNHTTTFTYNAGGQLIEEVDAAGHSVTLTRTRLTPTEERPSGWTVSYKSPSGLETAYAIESMADGSTVRTTTRPGVEAATVVAATV